MSKEDLKETIDNQQQMIDELNYRINNLNKETSEIKLSVIEEFERIIKICELNNLGNVMFKIRKIKELAKENIDIIKEDLYIQNDEENNIIELNYAN